MPSVREKYNPLKFGIMCAVIAAIFAMLSGAYVIDLFEYLSRQRFSEAGGTIDAISAKFLRTPSRAPDQYGLEGRYRFSVDGVEFTGITIGTMNRTQCWLKSQAEQIARTHGPQSHIRVRYDPHDPSKNFADIVDVSHFVVCGSVITGIIVLFAVLALRYGWMGIKMKGRPVMTEA